jgi:phosphoribosylglycinamide formyltransferase 1
MPKLLAVLILLLLAAGAFVLLRDGDGGSGVALQPTEPQTEQATPPAASEPAVGPSDEAAATDPPATDPPATDAPASDAPATDVPATEDAEGEPFGGGDDDEASGDDQAGDDGEDDDNAGAGEDDGGDSGDGDDPAAGEADDDDTIGPQGQRDVALGGEDQRDADPSGGLPATGGPFPLLGVLFIAAAAVLRRRRSVGRRVVVLISGSGSNLQALLDAPAVSGDIVAVVSDVVGAGGLERAQRAGVATVVVDRKAHSDRPAWEAALTEAVADLAPDVVVLAGFMRILSGAFVRRWPILNVHPSLLPAFPGAHAVDDALAYGVKVTGATVHFVVEEVDAGPIVLQDAVPVLPGDDAAALHERIKAVEHRLLPIAVDLFCSDRLVVDGRHVRITP